MYAQVQPKQVKKNDHCLSWREKPNRKYGKENLKRRSLPFSFYRINGESLGIFDQWGKIGHNQLYTVSPVSNCTPPKV